MIHGVFTLTFVLSCIMLIVLLEFFKKNISAYYALLFTAIVVVNFGYMQLISATELESAIYANQALYLGASFTPFLSFMCIADLCRIKIKPVLKLICVTVSCTVLACMLTIGKLPIYYKDVQLGQTESFSYLIKEYGPLHSIYPIYLVTMSLAALGIVIYSFKRRERISHITSTILTIIMTITMFTYVIERLLKSQIDFLPVAFVIEQIGILILLNRIRLYDISRISAITMNQSMKYGFIICSKGKLTGIDDAARKWFPEVNNLYIDCTIKDTSTDFLKQMHKWINSTDSDETVYFERQGKIIEAKNHIVSGRGKNIIHCISLRDDTQQQKYARLIENYNKNLEISVKAKTEKLKHIQNDILLSMASIVENRDNNTGGHIRRTSDIVKIFVKYLMQENLFTELTPEIADCIIKAAPLHDFGKIAIPDVILNKPGKFTNEEYDQMKKHSEKGASIVAGILQNSDDILFKNIAVNIAHYHHEKWDGTGYPCNLIKKEIPFEARIMALADVFDALVSKRVYKERFSYDRAFNIISDSCGKHFDPSLCTEFLKCRPMLEELYNNYGD